MRVVLSLLLLAATARADVLYVDDSARGADDGTSWADAFVRFQRALDAASIGDQIWVAEGTYRPSATGDRTKSFVVRKRVHVYGGFAGTETSLAERAGLFDRTVLSGDLARDDGEDFAGTEENSYHVVVIDTPTHLTETVPFDGFTITGGRADGPGVDGNGGGMWIVSAAVELENLRFVRNMARANGGALYWGVTEWTMRNSLLLENIAHRAGGAGAGPAFHVFDGIQGCRFLRNTARGLGGGALALFGDVGFPEDMSDCLFAHNSADGTSSGGGAIWSEARLYLSNCTFYANSARRSADGGGAIYARYHPSSGAQVLNSIVWDNVDDQGRRGTSQIDVGDLAIDVSFSCVQGGIDPDWFTWSPMTGVIDSDPLFVDPDGPDGVPGTEDDDLRLARGSPCIDTANHPYHFFGSLDALGQPRFVDSLTDCSDGALLDRGALERQEIDGTTNYCPQPPSSLGVPAVLRAPCVVWADVDNLTLVARPVPRGAGFFLAGSRMVDVPFHRARLCVGGRALRLPPLPTSGGELRDHVGLSVPPAFPLIEPGTTWQFQAVFRDPGVDGGLHLSDAVRVTILR